MRVVLAGGSGFLGTALADHLAARGDRVVVLTRQDPSVPASHPAAITYERWVPNGQAGAWVKALEGADAVVNLAGESIAAKRWSPAQKERIRQSRLLATHSLTAALKELRAVPPVLVSGSAVGYYGDRGEETLTEASTPGGDFLAGVCRDWEAAAATASAITRVTLIRTGLVLDRRGGALPKMLPPFLMFAGGPLGSGRQYMPWIHREDWVRLVAWIITSDAARGPINVTAPNPLPNRDFSRALGHALRRPSLLPAPGFALKLALGEMAEGLLLAGQRALPARALELGFPFRFPHLDAAFADILSGARPLP